jgi:hypothetical protein
MGWRCWVWRSWPSGFTGSDEPAGANWGRVFRELRRPTRLGVPDLATPGIQRPRPGRPKPAPGCTPAPEAGPPTPPRIGSPWAGAIPPTPTPLRAMATNRGAEIREGNERGMAGPRVTTPSWERNPGLASAVDEGERLKHRAQWLMSSASKPCCWPNNSAAGLAIGSTRAMRSDFCFRSASPSHRLPIGDAHHRQPIAGEWRQ